MSFSNILEGIKNKASELKTDILKFKNKAFLEAATAGAAMIALADGVVTADEKRKMMDFIKSYEPLTVFKDNDIINAFQSALNALEYDYEVGTAKLLDKIRSQKGNDQGKRLIMRLIIGIAAADGDFDDDEKKVAALICKELEINPKDFDLI